MLFPTKDLLIGKADVDISVKSDLRGMWTHLERQKGGIGMRGPGETEIETDRRIVRDKIALLKSKITAIDKQMSVQRGNRGKLIKIDQF